MKMKRLVLVSLSVAAILAAGSSLAGVGVGDMPEEVILEKREGGTARFPADYQEKIIFLNFWASWCPECKIEMPELNELKAKYKDDPFVLVAVNVDRKRRAAEKFLKKFSTDMTILFDTEQKMIQNFAPVGIPASYLIAPDGRVVKQYLGFSEGAVAQYRSDIEDLLARIKAKETAETGPAEEKAP